MLAKEIDWESNNGADLFASILFCVACYVMHQQHVQHDLTLNMDTDNCMEVISCLLCRQV